MTDKKYLKGLYANKKHKEAPDFIVCELRVKPSVLIESLQEIADKESYATYQVKVPYQEDADWPHRLDVRLKEAPPNRSQDAVNSTFTNAPETEDFDDDIPF